MSSLNVNVQFGNCTSQAKGLPDETADTIVSDARYGVIEGKLGRKQLVNLETNWRRLSKNINRPNVQSSLNVGMKRWCREFAHEPIWQPKRGPWHYSRTDYWAMRKRPRKDSPAWYQCMGACHYLRGFACALAQSTFPNIDWWIIEGELHSTVVGYSKSSIRVLDVLLWDYFSRNPVDQILDHAGFPNNCRYLTLQQEMAEA